MDPRVVIKTAVSVPAHTVVLSTKDVFYQGALNSNQLIYNIPYGAVGSKVVGNTKDYQNKTATAIKEIVTQFTNGTKGTWIEVSVDGKILGLLDKNHLVPCTTTLSTKGVFYQGTLNTNQLIYNRPYGALGSKVVGNTKDYQNRTATITKEIVTQFTNGTKGTWVETSVDGKVLGLLDKAHLVPCTTILSTTDVFYQGTLNTDQLIYNIPYGALGSKVVANTKDYQNKTATVAKEIVTQFTNGSKGTWIEISVGGKVLGLLDKAHLVPCTTILSMKEVFYQGTLKTRQLVYDLPYGALGSKVIGNTKEYVNSVITVTQEIVTKFTNGLQGTWIEIRLDGTVLGLVDKAHLTPCTTVMSSKEVSYQGTLKTGQLIYDIPYGVPGSKVIANSKDFQNESVKVTKEIVTQFTNGSQGTWIEINLNGELIGLIDKAHFIA
nr:GW dipeptide domain-containing protein [Vagococcus allomyrinae]